MGNSEEIKELQRRIVNLKEEKDVTLLAHYYQNINVQEIADFVGDSLGLSKAARNKADTNYIIFAGVLFMAETASILNPSKVVLMADKKAGCPLASFLDADTVKWYREKFPGVPIVVYVNSTAETKAEADVVCTSSNAVRVVEGIKKEFNAEKVLFGPDQNLADYVRHQTGFDIINLPDEGFCYVHHFINASDILNAKKAHPNALIAAHPECKREVLKLVDFVGSTKGMYDYVKDTTSDANEFVIGTETGFVQRVQQDFPDKKIYPVKDKFLCKNMKLTSLEKILRVLANIDDKNYEVKVPEKIAEKARISLEKMLKYS